MEIFFGESTPESTPDILLVSSTVTLPQMIYQDMEIIYFHFEGAFYYLLRNFAEAFKVAITYMQIYITKLGLNC